MNNIQKKFNSVIQNNVIFNMIESDYKAELQDELFEEQTFYLNVVSYFSELFGITEKDTIEDLSLAYYLLYKGIMQLDCLLDKNNLPTKEKLYRYMTVEILFNKADSIYHNIFSSENIFWKEYNLITKEYYSSYFITLSSMDKISEKEYHELTIKKNYPAIIPVLALACYADDFRFYNQVKDSLLDLHCWMQYYDDVVDFKADLIENNLTYPHILVSQFLNKNNLAMDKMEVSEINKYFHISKISLELLILAKTKLTGSLKKISGLNLLLYENDIAERLKELENLILFFEEKLNNGIH